MIPKTSAIIVTRGDVALEPIIKSLERPPFDEVIVWDNGLGKVLHYGSSKRPLILAGDVPDLSVYGRYAAIEFAANELIYVQDDDCIVSNPQIIRDAWRPGRIAANMPERFRHEGYTDSCLVGFGACFYRDLPRRAFDQWVRHRKAESLERMLGDSRNNNGSFLRTCDVVFTTLMPFVWVDVWHDDLPYASDMTRMWKQPDHIPERAHMLELARKVRDA